VIHLESRAKVVATKIADHLCVGTCPFPFPLPGAWHERGGGKGVEQVKLVAPPASGKFWKMLHGCRCRCPAKSSLKL